LDILLDDYVRAFSSAVSARGQPQADHLLAPGEGAEIGAGARVSARGGVSWVTVGTGGFVFAGVDSLPVDTSEAPFPLAPGAWLVSTAPATVTSSALGQLAPHDSTWQGLRSFQRIALEWSDHVLALERSQELERLRTRLRADEEVGSASLELLAGTTRDRTSESTDASASPLLSACRLVGRPLGIEMKPAPSWERSRTSLTDELRAIARASGVGYRRVVLTPGWSIADNGPLLGFVRDVPDDVTLEDWEAARLAPVALLQPTLSTYECEDPATGTRRPVDEKLEAALEGFAYQLYRSLPARALGARDLWRFVAFGSWRDARTILAMGALGAVLGLLLPILTGTVFDAIIPSADRPQLLNVFMALLVAAIATTAFQLTRSFAVMRFQARTESALQMAVLDRLVRLPLPFFRSYAAGDLALRARGISMIGNALGGATINTILSSLVSCASFALLFFYSVPLALVATAILLVNIAFLTATSAVALRYAREAEAAAGRLAGLVLELLGGIAKLRVAGAETRAFARWASEFRTRQDVSYKFRLFDNHVDVFNSVVPILSSLLLYWAFVSMTGDSVEGLTTGRFLAFSSAFGMFIASATNLTGTAIDLVRLIPAWERSKPILETVPEHDPDKPDPGELSGRIEVDRLTFRYSPDGPVILQDVSIEAAPGEFIALVGPSGAGKSTLLRILLGFDLPESSSVYYDGHDLASIDITAVRRQLGVVLQSSRLTAGDVFTNIVGTSSLTMDDAWEAVRMAGMEEDIEAMPMGLHTMVAEGGGTLSGGQRQRLLIARALVTRPRILFFDEATSALDNRAQQIVSESIDRLHATRVVIAHRISTIRNADRIYVMEGGRVVQSGTFDELMAVPGLFAELARRQEA
ncbi:MAG: NHLP bacteriocin export ABC transporter permease/ATPase subunit, partial [Longimicrobiales bacterium]